MFVLSVSLVTTQMRESMESRARNFAATPLWRERGRERGREGEMGKERDKVSERQGEME